MATQHRQRMLLSASVAVGLIAAVGRIAGQARPKPRIIPVVARLAGD